ncbi:23S rRNA (pseudouridine1915-N3)-methyltransferase [Scopulibacillus darangshiensis]|uniref:Ribosomal RNA large subunit methyltransferase H n=1 Tax=Scopulibacillus darangshiensis TaxID=442528 RepID=A0A4R2NPR8_9BACL|nr:23S rRNA (pseudouridine(1915)-N(3))-methyltransferase RlmH [Scopulibacillus darangshiensis]TCP23431.1 23S rRNA (pseudouridine1915-N3)-methyltransferase [Scopulibacillus darangshiensis]
MNIHMLTVGKLKERYIKQGIDEYVKRLGPYAKVVISEVPDEKAPDNLSPAQIQQIKCIEGDKLLAKVSPDTYVIALAIEGKQLSSETLASQLDNLATYGKSKIAFVIGGSHGLSDAVLERADMHLSFSKMTFPHQLMRLILVEQVYRAFKIIRGETYHK